MKDDLVYAFSSDRHATKMHNVKFDFTKERVGTIEISIDALCQIKREKNRIDDIIEFIETYIYECGIRAIKDAIQKEKNNEEI